MRKNYSPGITEKRLNNRRFRRSEEAILRIFFEEKIFIGAKDMAKKAGVARSTFYHHHRTVREIVPDYKRYILRKYNRLVKKVDNKNDLRMVFERMMIFIVQNKKIFEILLKTGDNSVLRNMLMLLRSEIIKYARLPKNHDKAIEVYFDEVVGLITRWIENGCDNDGRMVLIVDVIYLTNTLRPRLKGLVEN